MSRTRRAAAFVIALCLVTAIAEVAQGGNAVIRGVTRTGGGGRWRPSSVSVSRGDRVVWRAVEGNHNVTSYGNNWDFSRDLPEGTRVRKTFRSRGTFRFLCTIHGDVTGGDCSGMCGRVVVG